MALIISQNEKLKKNLDKTKKLFSCRSNCTMDKKCCLNNVIYQAKVSIPDNYQNFYIGSTKKAFIYDIINTRPRSLNSLKKNNNFTQIANHLCNLNDNNT